MAKLISIFWRDIPAQVIGRVGRDNFKRELPPRFAKAIDKAAMRAGRGTSQAYLDDWRRESEVVTGDVEQLVLERVALLESRFPQELLDKVVHAGGVIAGVAGIAGIDERGPASRGGESPPPEKGTAE